MATFFHVSPFEHEIGSIIQPGRYGEFIRQFVKGGQIGPDINLLKSMTWEAVLETSRRLVAPQSPSRMSCIFACNSASAAGIFRDKFRSGAAIYKVSSAEETPIFTGDLDMITTTENGSFIDIWVNGALRYWTNQPQGAHEVLIGGPVTVVEKL